MLLCVCVSCQTARRAQTMADEMQAMKQVFLRMSAKKMQQREERTEQCKRLCVVLAVYLWHVCACVLEQTSVCCVLRVAYGDCLLAWCVLAT